MSLISNRTRAVVAAALALPLFVFGGCTNDTLPTATTPDADARGIQPRRNGGANAAELFISVPVQVAVLSTMSATTAPPQGWTLLPAPALWTITVLGLVLSVCIVHSRTLDRALLPWIVASQSVPVLAIAPIVLVILGSLGFSGVAPKATIAMYLCFFPVTVAMVAGLRSPQKIEMEMMHTYAASRWHTLWLLRMPAALPFLFPALRVGVSAGLVGAMVAELPTGAVAGLGARLLTGSYYGQTVQIWSALVMSALLGLALTAAVALVERLVLRNRGGVA